MVNKNYIFVIVGLAAIIVVLLYIIFDNRIEMSSMQQHYDSLIVAKEVKIEEIRSNIELFATVDSTYYDSLQIIKEQLSEMEASRSWWFRQHEAIRDSINNLTIDQLQEYFTNRYP